MRISSCLVLFLMYTSVLWQTSRGADADGEPEEATRKAGQVLHSVQLEPQRGPRSVDERWLITNDTLGSILKEKATPRKEVLFTTIRLPATKYTSELDMIKNFCHYVEEAGAIKNLIILTTDNVTWSRLHNKGLPVYLDRAFPERVEYMYGMGKAPDSPNRVFDVQKHWWGWKLVNEGYLAAYMDADAVPLKDPFLAFVNNTYDVQGLSDWDEVIPQMPADSLSGGCKLYYWIEDPATVTGTILREYWNFPDPVVKTHAHNPCQSTGVWYVRPTPPAVAFMLAMTQRLSAPSTRHQWDQTAWNEVILPFLWGNGEVEPLSYRLLPHANYANVGVVDKRLEAGMSVDLVVLHSGYLHGDEKKDAYIRMGVWNPSNITRSKSTRFTSAKEESVLSAATTALNNSLLMPEVPLASFGTPFTSQSMAHNLSVLGLLVVLAFVLTLAFSRRRSRRLALRNSFLPIKTKIGGAPPTAVSSPSRASTSPSRASTRPSRTGTLSA